MAFMLPGIRMDYWHCRRDFHNSTLDDSLEAIIYYAWSYLKPFGYDSQMVETFWLIVFGILSHNSLWFMVIFLSLFSEEWLVKEILAIKKEKRKIPHCFQKELP